MKISTKEMVTSALLIAVAVILSFPMFKLMGSIGFDALPAYLGAVVLGPALGGVIGGLAHLVSALLTGFPLGPVHIVVMVTMFAACYAYGYTRQKTNRYVAIAVGIIMNAPVSLLFSAIAAQLILGAPGVGLFMSMIGPLTLASAVNVILADVVYGLVGSTLKETVRA